MNKTNYKLASTLIVLAVTAIQSFAQSIYEPYTFTTLAGVAPVSDGTGSAARFNYPTGVAVDSFGNVYVADSRNHTIRKVTPAGVVTTPVGLAGSAGSADGTGSAARFSFPSGIAVDSAGNIYVGDWNNHTIRKMTPAGVVTTLAGLAGSAGSADGTGSAARFSALSGLAVDSAGNVYVADLDNNTIRKVTPTGVVTTLAGLAGSSGSADGTGSTARFHYPSGVAVDSVGNIYVADAYNTTIRKVTAAGVVTTMAGQAKFDAQGYPVGGTADGIGNEAQFNWPTGVAVDNVGNVYVADVDSGTIRKVTSTGAVTTLAAGFGIALVDASGGAQAVAVDGAGTVYVADTANFTIRKVTPAGMVTTLAGQAQCCFNNPVGGSADGTGSAAQFSGPSGVAVDSMGNVYVADSENDTVRKVTAAGSVTTLAGLAGSSGSADGTGSAARFCSPRGVAVDGLGNLYVVDGNGIRKVTPVGVVTTLAGLEGQAVAVDSAGDLYLAVGDSILKATLVGNNWVITTVAGTANSYDNADGTGSAARFRYPQGLAVDSTGNVYLADTGNKTIRKVTPTGVVTTLAGLFRCCDANGDPFGGEVDGIGTEARFSGPSSVSVDSTGNVYVASADLTIRKVTPAGSVTTLAGGGYGSADGTGSDARFDAPSGVAVDSSGNVYVTDSDNGTIRKGSPAPRILTAGPGFGLNGGQFGFNLTGPAGRSAVVEVSTDLANWRPLWTNTFTFPATLNFNDLRSGAYPNRFYRLRLP